MRYFFKFEKLILGLGSFNICDFFVGFLKHDNFDSMPCLFDNFYQVGIYDH